MSSNAWIDLLGLIGSCLLSVAATIHILFHKRLPHNATLWILVVWLMPVVGFLCYWYFGYNRVQRRLRVAGLPVPGRLGSGEKPLKLLGQNLTGLPLRGGNRVDLLEDGAEAYPAMLEAIASATRSIDLLTYIFDADEVGERFIAALTAAASKGVKVRVLVDGVGAWGPLRRLRKSLGVPGIEFASFWRSDHLFHQPLLNLRNHRKLLIVDSQLAFTGSLNISRRHHKGPLSRRPLRRWRPALGSQHDLHFRLRGPLVADLIACFQEDWTQTHPGGKRAAGAVVKPKSAGSDLARVVSSGPDQTYERIYELLLGGLRMAQKKVDLCTPYFIPDQALLALLRSLSLSGVHVRLLVPQQGDHAFLGWASRSYFRDLLQAGVEIWEIRGDFVHSKVVVVDGRWCLLGSCNLDPRSFLLNFETNIEVYSEGLAKRLSKVMEKYRAQASPVDLGSIKRQGFFPRLRDNIARLFSPIL